MNEKKNLNENVVEGVPQEIQPLPAEWNYDRLSNVTEIEMGSSPKSDYYNKDGDGLPFHQGNNEFGMRRPNVSVWCSNPVNTAESGSILMSVRAPVGDVNITNQTCCIGRGITALQATDINCEYLFQHLQERKKWLERISSGSTYDSINSSQVKLLNIRIPPLPEQRKIASVLYNVDQAIQKTEEMIEQTKWVKKGVMQDLFADGYYEHDNFARKRIGPGQFKIPRKWQVERLERVTEKVTDGTHMSPPTIDEGYPYLTSKNIRDWGFDLSDMKYISKKDHDKITSRCNPIKEDILLVKDGANTGIVRKNTLDFEFSLLSSVALIRPNHDRINSDYLEQFLSWDGVKKYFLSRMSGTGISRLTINKIKDFEILVPSLEEQTKISDVLKPYERYISENMKLIKSLKSIKKGLMQNLLTGKVRTKDKDLEVLDEVLQIEEGKDV